MKDFSNEQKIVFITSVIAVLLLIYQVIYIKLDTKEVIVKNNRSKIENIKKLEASLKEFNDFTFLSKKDLFFYPKKKTIVVKKAVIKKKIKGKTTWVFYKVKPYDSDKLKMLMYVDGKVKLSIKGKKKDYKLGDKIPIGLKMKKQLYENNKPTGKTRQGREYLGKILYLSKRITYIELPSNKALKIELGNKPPKIIPKSQVPATNNSEEDSDSESHFRGRGRG